MNAAPILTVSSLEEAATLSLQQIAELIGSLRNREKTEALLRQEITALKQQLDWFKR
jgi:hypothetical protein